MPSPCPPISVAFPIHVAPPGLESAFACIAAQSVEDLDIVLVLNGSDGATRERVHALAASDGRARVVELARANLSAALNAALRSARHDLVARMDADDECPPHRLGVQAAAIADEPVLAGVGCAYRVCTPEGRPMFTVRPPLDAGEVRWRLLLCNMLAHGSMLLRRAAVLSVGGYDESLRRAQDYDLWLRLTRSHRIGTVADVLYDYRAPAESGADRSGAEQAENAARCMVREWRLLAERDESEASERAIAGVLCRDHDPEAARSVLAAHMTARGPTRETLAAWNWAAARVPNPPVSAMRAARRALVREVTRGLRERGSRRVWLYPGGAFTRDILQHAEDFAIPIAGVVDDAATPPTLGEHRIVRPQAVPAGDDVLIASDWHEDALWSASEAMRLRGVGVHRLHAFDATSGEVGTSVDLGRGGLGSEIVHANAARSKVA